MRIIGNDQKNNGQNFWEILERIIDKISSIMGARPNPGLFCSNFYLRQKLSKRKVLQLTGFHLTYCKINVVKTFVGLALSVLKVLQKSTKRVKLFPSLNFYRLRYYTFAQCSKIT